MIQSLPLWIEVPVAILLLVSAAFALVSAWGIARMEHFFLRMHPPGLIYTGSTWSLCLASVLYFSAQSGSLQLRVWVIPVVLSITVPITTVLLARAALFRNRRDNGLPVPPPLQPDAVVNDEPPPAR